VPGEWFNAKWKEWQKARGPQRQTVLDLFERLFRKPGISATSCELDVKKQ